MDLISEIEIKTENEDPEDIFLDTSIVKEEYALQSNEENTPTEYQKPEEFQEMKLESVQFVIQDVTEKEEASKIECHICGRKFSMKCHLAIHLQFHSDGKTRKCPECDKVFKTRNNFERHLEVHRRRKEKQEKEHKCQECGKTFSTKYKLTRHMGIHFNFRCRFCNEIYTSERSLQKHKIECKAPKSQEIMKHKCLICGRRCSNLGSLRNHVRSHENDAKNTCTVCSRVFINRSRLKEHMEVHREDENLPCDICGRIYRTSFYLRYHKRTQHNPRAQVPTEMECALCGKKFLGKRLIREHIRRVHLGIKRTCVRKKKNIPCKLCGKIFTQTQHFMIHLRTIHGGNQEVDCPHCLKTLKNDQSLRGHISRVHSDRIFSCKICDSTFLCKLSLTRHLRTHENAPETCYYCKSVVKNAERLKTHILRNHRDLPRKLNANGPVKCPRCQESLEDLTVFRQHFLAVHPFESLKCEICEKEFTRRGNLLKHLANVHGQNNVYSKKEPSTSKDFTESEEEEKNADILIDPSDIKKEDPLQSD